MATKEKTKKSGKADVKKQTAKSEPIQHQESSIKNQELWYKDAIIYELHIKAFFDSNGDGIGDFRGLLQKLDYIQDLGVTAIWLLPFYPSPLRDDGYDIADYYSINPNYGSINDFKKFMKEAHKRGLKVITELVVNHTSDQHPWFQRARIAPKGSPERDYYVWTDDPEKYKGTRIIFTDTETSNWTFDPVAGQYYWHRFFSHQPDLNFDNPKVQQEIFRVLDYWMEMGVDGFRLDAVPYLFEREGTNCENLPETHVFLKKLRAHVDKHYKNKLLLAEANMWPEDSVSYFGQGDECHMNYHFPLMPRMFMAVRMEDRYPIIDIWDQTPEIPENCQWGMFLRNHDELTLEMVTDEERDYMYKVYTKDVQARINVGIRHRLAPLLDNNRKKIELMNTLLLSLPGTPIIYYGDEIGMGDNYYLGDRDGVRTPMQWSADRNAGFSQANPQKLYLPTIIDPEYSYEAVNVETQRNNLSSLWWWMKRVLTMRKKFKAFGRGDIKFLSPTNSKVLAFTRTYEDETILVIANLSRFAQAVELELQDYVGHVPQEVFSQNKFPSIKDEPYLFTLSPHGYYWFSLKKEDVTRDADLAETVQFSLSAFKDLEKGKTISELEENILPRYLQNCRWFGGKARTIQQINVKHKLPISYKGGEALWLIFEVTYNEGLPEFYQLPVTFATGEEERHICHTYRAAVVAKVEIKEKEGILFDAFFDKGFQEYLFKQFGGKKATKSGLLFDAEKPVKNFLKLTKEYHPKVLGAEQSNTSVVYNDQFFMKLYRKIDENINPDAEIIRKLTEDTEYQNIPRYQGEIILQSGRKQPMVLAMLQELVPNQGDAWELMKDVLKRFMERVESTEIKRFPTLKGEIHDPVRFESLNENVREIIGGVNAERASLLGQRTAELHLALASIKKDKEFEAEDFSLHYQRSLFSSLQSLVRGSFTTLEKNMKSLPKHLQKDAQQVMDQKKDVLKALKRIFVHKFDALKIRTHGDYHLGQVLFTGKDFIIIDFEGEPARSFSERRLKRSALRDVAGMIRSFHYAAYSSIMHANGDKEHKERWAELWYHYMSSFFMRAYLDTVGDSPLIPQDKEDLRIMLDTFILEKAIYELGYELNNRPDWVLIPLKGILYIMGKD